MKSKDRKRSIVFQLISGDTVDLEFVTIENDFSRTGAAKTHKFKHENLKKLNRIATRRYNFIALLQAPFRLIKNVKGTTVK